LRKEDDAMRRSLVLAGVAPLNILQELTRSAEEAGLYRVWTIEGTGGDGIVRALAIGVATSRIQVATGIAYTFPKLPLHTAGMVAEVQDLLGGRFTLGLGAGTRGIRRRYGLEEDHPAPRFGEYVDLVRDALDSDGGFEFSGKFYRSSAPLLSFAGDPARRRATRIYGSGVNRIMLETAAAHCDGVGLHPVAGIQPYFDEVALPALALGHRRSAKRRDEKLSIALWYICSVHEDRVIARQRAADVLAFYFSTPSYGTPLQGSVWAGVAVQVRDAFRAAVPNVDWRALGELIPEEMIDELCLAGTRDEVSERLIPLEHELAERGVDELVLEPTSHSGVTEFRESCEGIIRVAAAGNPRASETDGDRR
jgi:alkanesulfonate monooxygenase SsuD/methylene tetrahydromethanopterin reductase-like flavin-dependent oxidoreductase (luciferase family)